MTIANKTLSLVLIISALLLTGILTSCNDKMLYAEAQQIIDAEWSSYNNLLFYSEINDTSTICDMSITLRSNSDYPFRNIFLFVTTTSPAGYSIKDTLEYQLANEKGEWLGKGLGDIHDISLPYKSNIIFPESGKYIFSIEQGMRREELPGIIDVGIRIKKHKKQK